jgi:hypothetical protein
VVGLRVRDDLFVRQRRARRVAPEGSPIIEVKSPIRRSPGGQVLHLRILFSTTVWLMWMSGAV